MNSMKAVEQAGCLVQVKSSWAVQQGEGTQQWRPDIGCKLPLAVHMGCADPGVLYGG